MLRNRKAEQILILLSTAFGTKNITDKIKMTRVYGGDFSAQRIAQYDLAPGIFKRATRASLLLLRWQRACFFVYFFLVKKSKVLKVLIFQVVVFPLDLAIARMVLAVGRPFSLCTLVSQYRKGYFDKVTNLFIYLF